MIVKKMNGSDDISIYSSPEANALKDLIKEIEKYFSKHLHPVYKGDNAGRVKECENDNIDCCLLEFFYYIKKGGGAKNGIWIRINKSDKWIFVLANPLGNKKADIHSAANLHCPKYPQTHYGKHYLSEYFTTPAYYEGNRVAPISYMQLMLGIINRLDCVC